MRLKRVAAEEGMEARVSTPEAAEVEGAGDWPG